MKTVTICGSMRFEKEMRKIAFELESKYGWVVLQCTYNDCGVEIDEAMLKNLAYAHFAKIDISDTVYVADIGGYIGDAVRSEIKYAEMMEKEIIFHSKSSLIK